MEREKICLKCNSKVDSRVRFCPYCGSSEFRERDRDETALLRAEDNPYSQDANAQQSNTANSMRENPQRSQFGYSQSGQAYQEPVQNQYFSSINSAVQYPMKWFKFLIYFLLFASAVLNFDRGIKYITGIIYSEQTQGQVTSDMVYAVYGALKGLDVFYGIISILFGGFALYTRFRLAKYKANAPMCLYILYAAVVGLGMIYNIVLFVLTGIFNNVGIIYMIIQVVVFVLNYIYFTKRKTLFVN